MVWIDESLWFWLRLSGTAVWSRSWPVLDKYSISELHSTQSFPFILHRDKVTSCTQAILEQEFGFLTSLVLGFQHCTSSLPGFILCQFEEWTCQTDQDEATACTPTGTVRRITVLCSFLIKPSPGLFFIFFIFIFLSLQHLVFPGGLPSKY